MVQSKKAYDSAVQVIGQTPVVELARLTKNVDAAHGFWFLPHIQNVE